MQAVIDSWLQPFKLHESLHGYVAAVIGGLPAIIQDDLLTDPTFRLSDYEPVRIANIPAAPPSGRTPARSIALKRTLRHRPPEFIRYVIAHELAHAFLRNGGRWPGDDPELAADSLAAEWGFARP